MARKRAEHPTDGPLGVQWAEWEAAAHFGVAQATLHKRVVGAGLKTGRGVKHPPAAYYKALEGNIAASRAREARARAEWLEARNRRQNGELVEVSSMVALYTGMAATIQTAYRRLEPALWTSFHTWLTQEQVIQFSKRFIEEMSFSIEHLWEHVLGEHYSSKEMEKDMVLMLTKLQRQEEEIEAQKRLRLAQWEAAKQSAIDGQSSYTDRVIHGKATASAAEEIKPPGKPVDGGPGSGPHIASPSPGPVVQPAPGNDEKGNGSVVARSDARDMGPTD